MKIATPLVLSLTFLTPLPACGQESPTPSVNIHLAALQGNIEVIRQHLEAGSDLNERDAYGSTPLIVAAAFGRTEVVKVLIEAGADPNSKNNGGATALHTAAFLCRTDIVKALLDNGANKYLRDNYGNTPAEAVADPFDAVKDIYDAFSENLGPLGLELDYEQIRTTRPRIAEMLRPQIGELEAVQYTPASGDDWKISTPAEQGLDPMLVGELYLGATGLSNLYGLLVIKNGHLVAEGYLNEGAPEQTALLQSVTKSYTSALVGIALDRGCLSSVEQKMISFFPELVDQINDPRKKQITVRDMLQMRAGYPWEESDPALWEALVSGDYLPPIVEFPLIGDPGTEFHYSNLTSHWLGVIVARACETDLKSFATEYLFSPIDVKVGEWMTDKDGYYIGGADIRFTARDAARFGLLYLNHGEYEGNQVVSADWVRESLQSYTKNISSGGIESGEVGRYFRDVGYGYQWWSASAGAQHFNFAWGHGGQLIILLDELDMIVVVIADPFYIQHDEESWRHEKAVINLVGKFIESLPKG
ncbi:MAG: serine hydrolase [Gemmatimonadota bacterium]|nr:MAG: serine hydrolase [Gemmatimonadota bacterium]